MFDLDLLSPEVDLDLADFDTLDALDSADAQDFRSLSTGLPARPGTLR
jgi:hypothetical protein